MTRYAALALAAFLVGCDSQTGITDEKLPPVVPAQTAPVDGADDVPDDLAVEWTPVDPGVAYHVVVASDPDFRTVRAEAAGLSEARLVLTDLQVGGTYWWRVRSISGGRTSAWSPTWSFTPSHNGLIPPVPELVSPVHNEITQLETIVYWAAVQGAVSYDLQVAQEDVFVRMDVDREGIEGTYRPLDNLIHGYEYFWRVRARNYSGVSAWTPSRRFLVGYDPPGT